jgi:phytoene desaturase
MKVTIIGAGIGGLASAVLLATQGHQVHVFEKNGRVGGKMNYVKKNGFRFDTGPSLFTMPYILDKLYSNIGTKLQDELKLSSLSPICRYFYKDGTIFDCFDNKNKTLEQIRKFAPEDEKAYLEFLHHSEALYNKTLDSFILNPLYELKDLKNLDILSFFGIDAFSTVSNRVDSIFQSEYLRKFFKRFTTYNGSSPYQAPATLNVIPHVEINQGGFYIEGGLYTLADNLFKIAKSKDVKFNFNSNVNKIELTRNKVSGIVVNNNVFPSDIVVSNSDATETIVRLLETPAVSRSKKKKAMNIEPSCSGFVLLVGINKKYDQLVHHNLFFTSDYKKSSLKYLMKK